MSQLFETRFKNYISQLTSCPYDVPEELHPHMRQALLNAGFDQPGPVTLKKTQKNPQ